MNRTMSQLSMPEVSYFYLRLEPVYPLQAYQEELILLGFQHEETQIQHDRKLKATGLKRKDLQLQIDENKRIDYRVNHNTNTYC